MAPMHELSAAVIFIAPDGADPQLYAEVGIGSQHHHHINLPPLLMEHILAAPRQILPLNPPVEATRQSPIQERSPQWTATASEVTPLSGIDSSDTIEDPIPTPVPTTKNSVPFYTPVYKEEPQSAIFGPLSSKFESSLAIAIRVGASLEGFLLLARCQPQPFQTRELSMLQYLGQQAALAMTYRRRLAETSQSEHRLRDTQHLHHLILEASQEGVWGWDIRHRRLYLSARWKRILGYRKDSKEPGNHPNDWIKRIHPEDHSRFLRKMKEHMDGESSHLEIEHRLQCQDGTYRWMLCRGIADRREGKAHRLVGTLTDIHDQKLEVEKLQYRSLHDPLTGLPNRALFLDRLGQTLKKRKRQKDYQFAVLFIDLDQFKQINDSLGHHVGDQLLRAVSHRLRTCLRTGDSIARLGGDEFVLLLDNLANKEGATEVAQRVQTTLRRPFLFYTSEVRISSSIGIALCAEHYNHPEEMLQDADTAMYQAKANGKDLFCLFEPKKSPQGSTRTQLKKELHLALPHEQLRLHYQPIISLTTGEVVGLEALVRWQHPERGLLLPHEFLPSSEENGLIVPMSWWVLQEACHQMKQWQAQYHSVPPLDLHVNLSSQALVHTDLVDQVNRCLRETKLAPFSLHIELTEETLLNNTSAIQELCDELVKHYVHFDLDDFGIGFSSLSYLHRFPLHTLKIDRSFIKTIGMDQTTNSIIRTIALIANELGIDLVAEGVEHVHQRKLLQQLHCPHAQGFLFAEPMPPTTIETYLQQSFL